MLDSVSAGQARGVNFTQYKTMKQYQSIGQTLDELRVYGYRAGRENIINRACDSADANGHNWLTVEAAGEEQGL